MTNAHTDKWRHWKGGRKDKPAEFDCFSLLTILPNAVIKPIHSEALPVILDTEEVCGYPDGRHA